MMKPSRTQGWLGVGNLNVLQTRLPIILHLPPVAFFVQPSCNSSHLRVCP